MWKFEVSSETAILDGYSCVCVCVCVCDVGAITRTNLYLTGSGKLKYVRNAILNIY